MDEIELELLKDEEPIELEIPEGGEMEPVSWGDVLDKPFEEIGEGLEVEDNKLNAKPSVFFANHYTYSGMGTTTPFADIMSAISNNKQVVLKHYTMSPTNPSFYRLTRYTNNLIEFNNNNSTFTVDNTNNWVEKVDSHSIYVLGRYDKENDIFYRQGSDIPENPTIGYFYIDTTAVKLETYTVSSTSSTPKYVRIDNEKEIFFAKYNETTSEEIENAISNNKKVVVRVPGTVIYPEFEDEGECIIDLITYVIGDSYKTFVFASFDGFTSITVYLSGNDSWAIYQEEINIHGKEDKSNKKDTVNDSSIEYISGKALFNYFASGNNGRSRDITHQNLNNIYKAGVYNGTSVTNAPTSVSSVYMLVIPHYMSGYENKYFSQIIFNMDNSKDVYVRNFINGVPASWKKIAMQSDLDGKEDKEVIDLLWENPNPQNEFDEGVIVQASTLTGYKKIEIVMFHSTTAQSNINMTSATLDTRITKGIKIIASSGTFSNSSRVFYLDDNNNLCCGIAQLVQYADVASSIITFGNSRKMYAIPYKIYGIK